MSEYVKHEIMLPKELSDRLTTGSRLVFRKPRACDPYIDQEACIFAAPQDFEQCLYIVIEPAWTAPDWMPRGWWLAMDADGEWWLYPKEPTYGGEAWYAPDGERLKHFNWTPPIVDGAEDSLRQI